MKFLPLILRNTFRNRRRTVLTILSISMSLFLISTLRTLLDSLESPALTPDSATRVLTRHQTSLANTMPIAYRERIRNMTGVKEVSAYQWLGAIYKDPAYFFAQFAVDADRFFDIYTDIHVVAPEQKDAFLKERRAGLAGVSLAKRYGWNIGGTVTLQGTFISGDIPAIICGFIQDGGSANLPLLPVEYLNQPSSNFD